jgi:IclR-like helix-turn-helix domain-containing protein
VNSIELEAKTVGGLRDREGLSTREIAERTGLPQSTVVRRLKLHDTGPQRILRGPARVRKNLLPAALLAFSILLVIAAAGAFMVIRAPRTVTIVPASICIRSARNTITGLTSLHGNSCPHGWTLLVLTPRP